MSRQVRAAMHSGSRISYCPAYTIRMARVEARTFSFAAATLVCLSVPSFVAALDSPLPIGYRCGFDAVSVVEGQYYHPLSDPCVYISSSLSFGPRTGDLYRGTIGNATLLGGHGLGFASFSEQFGDVGNANLFGVQQGEDMVVAIFRDFNGAQSAQFRNYFMNGVGVPPHQDY